MGYERVTITHGTLEFGRDICFLEVDRLGRQIWRGVQIKASTVSGSLSSDAGIRNILNQCQAALDTPYVTSEGKEVLLYEIILISTHPISEHAKLSVKGMLQQLGSSFHIIDGPKLADMIETYLPNLIESGLLRTEM